MSESDETEGDFWRGYKEARQERRRTLGVDCPGCPLIQPKRIPTVLLPRQKCKVCGYRDKRPRINDAP